MYLSNYSVLQAMRTTVQFCNLQFDDRGFCFDVSSDLGKCVESLNKLRSGFIVELTVNVHGTSQHIEFKIGYR